MAKKKNKFIWFLAAAVVLLIIFIVIGKSAGVLGKEEGARVSAAKAETRTIIETVSANGKVQPEVEVKISSDVSGEVRELYVKEGDSVQAGKLLAVIDPELYQSSLDRAEASLNNSRANLATAKARQVQAEAKFNEVELQHNRNIKLHEQKLLSDQDFETSRSNYNTQKAEVEAAKQNVLASQYSVQSMEAGVKEARKNLTRTEIFAPVSGIVSKLSIEKGERVVGTSQMAGTEMMRIANLNNMEVNVDVNENDIVKVNLSDTTLIEVDAYNSRKFKGIVTEIANSASTTTATTSDQVTNFVVKIRILRSSYEDLLEKAGSKRAVFRPGMSASVDIQTATAYNVIAVPIEAVTIRDKSELDSAAVGKKTSRYKTTTQSGNKKNDAEVVFILKDNKAFLKEVKTGVQDDKFIEVLSGLTTEDEVITGPYSAISRTLRNGDLVQKVEKSELFESGKPAANKE